MVLHPQVPSLHLCSFTKVWRSPKMLWFLKMTTVWVNVTHISRSSTDWPSTICSSWSLSSTNDILLLQASEFRTSESSFDSFPFTNHWHPVRRPLHSDSGALFYLEPPPLPPSQAPNPTPCPAHTISLPPEPPLYQLTLHTGPSHYLSNMCDRNRAPESLRTVMWWEVFWLPQVHHPS